MARTFDWEAVKAYTHADQTELGDRYLNVLLSIGAAASAAGLIFIIWAAGWHEVWRSVDRANWAWLAMAPAGVLVSHLGYALAYREVARIDEGPDLSTGHTLALVTTGFGPVSPRGGFVLDQHELEKQGLSRYEARHRVSILGMLEYAALAPAVFVAALFMMVAGHPAQSGLLPSWVIGVPAGTAVAVGLLARYRARGRPRTWWAPVRRFVDALESLLELLRTWPQGPLALAGMVIYWAAEVAALSGCLEAFVHRRGTVAMMIVGYATGYALTRRSLPLGSAGVVEALLPWALSWVGFPLASAVVSVVAYRLFNLWVAVLPAVVGLRRLRRAVTTPAPPAGTGRVAASRR